MLYRDVDVAFALGLLAGLALAVLLFGLWRGLGKMEWPHRRVLRVKRPDDDDA